MSRAEQDLLAGLALTAFKLNGQFLELAEGMARPAGLTAAWWQVLGAVLAQPLPVAGIAREMGITRQSVQRIADRLVNEGLAEYRDNPAHQRAKLLQPTEAGRATVARIAPAHATTAHALAQAGGAEELQRALDAMTELSKALDAVPVVRPEHPVAQFIDDESVEKAATPANVRLGRELAAHDQVAVSSVDVGRVEARVAGGRDGTQRRRVALWSDEDGLSWSCTCTTNTRRACKHVVALAVSVGHKSAM